MTKDEEYITKCCAFKRWIIKLGYKVKPMKHNGFYFQCGKEKGFMTDKYSFSPLAKKLMSEFETYYDE